jgi:hypothetical protein
MTILFGLGAALIYGAADFFGAVASKQLRPLLVTAFAACAGFAFIVFASFSFGDLGQGAVFTSQSITWGLIGGAFSAIGMSCLYAALALGPISIVSPLSALVAALVPTVAGVAAGETFSFLGWLAIALVLVAVALVGFVPSQDLRLPTARALALSVGAGIGIGVVMICLKQPPADTGLATAILIRGINAVVMIAASLLFVVLGRVKSREVRGLSWVTWVLIALTGCSDSMANVLFRAAAFTGTLTIASVLTALYPAGTILLARFVLKEKLAAVQTAGIILAMGASVLLALA